MAERNYTPYQQKIIQRYYDHQPTLLRQRLAELVGDLYLAQGKKRTRLWSQAAEAMQRLGVPQSRVDHLVQKGDPTLLAELVKELDGT
jgi:ATP/maltotriose-dependent transcriptional regulator MalT